MDTSKILLISNSTLFGHGYLDHVMGSIQETIGAAKKIIFIPFALFDRDAYACQVSTRFARIGCESASLHTIAPADRPQAILDAEALFVGGGNTFRLLCGLYQDGLIKPIRDRVTAGMPYVGSSAGSIVAGPSIKTTKDMPILHPPSFDALGIFPFQISPHFLDPDPASAHMGETQEQRILQFLEENETPVIGLREGSFIVSVNGKATLQGNLPARLFMRNLEPTEMSPGTCITDLVKDYLCMEKEIR